MQRLKSLIKFLVEPSTIFMGFPRSYIKLLVQKGIIIEANDQYNLVYCNTTMLMSFKLNGQEFKLDIGKYIMITKHEKYDGICYLVGKIADYR